SEFSVVNSSSKPVGSVAPAPTPSAYSRLSFEDHRASRASVSVPTASGFNGIAMLLLGLHGFLRRVSRSYRLKRRKNGVGRVVSVDQHVWARNTCGFAERVVAGERAGTVGDALDVAVGVEIEVRAVHVEPHIGVVFDALQCVHRVGGLVE